MANNEKTNPDDPFSPRPDPRIPNDPCAPDFLPDVLIGIKGWCENFVPGIGANPERLRHYTEIALYILNQSVFRTIFIYNERLENIPLAQNPNCPTRQDIIRLLRWFSDVYAEEKVVAVIERESRKHRAESAEEDESGAPLSWMYDSSHWEEIKASGEQWVGPLDPDLRFDEDTKRLTYIDTVEDCITHLKKILPYWIDYDFAHPGSLIVAQTTHTIRCWLLKVRHDSPQELPPIPPDLIGIVDWIRDVEKILAGGTTRKETDDFTAQDRAEIARGAIVQATVANGVDATQSKPDKSDDDGLTKAERCAYQSYEYAVRKDVAVVDPTDNKVYDWLKENGTEGDYELPERETWKRQVRAGRKYHGTQKNTPRAGREGRSTIGSRQIQSLSEISSQYGDEAD